MSFERDMKEMTNQMDIRVNIGEDQGYLGILLKRLDTYWLSGKIKYYHATGVEKGDNTNIPDVCGKLHVHIALVLFNSTSLLSVWNHLKLSNYAGYYLAARDKKKPISGWIQYHAKMRTKLPKQPSFIVLKGELPSDRRTFDDEERQRRDVEFKSTKQQEWALKKKLIITGDFDRIDREFPGWQWSSTGRYMKQELMKQRSDEHCKPLEGTLNNFIIWGPSGTGKSASVAFLFPNAYKKQKGTQFWDGYDRENPDHKVVWIDEMSKETLKCVTGKADGGFEFLKELGDRHPVSVDAKYMPAQKIRPTQIIITMNEHPTSLLPDRASSVNKEALYRKFKIMHVADWLALHCLKCEKDVGVRRDTIDLTHEPSETIDLTHDNTDSGSETEGSELELSPIIHFPKKRPRDPRDAIKRHFKQIATAGLARKSE